MVLSGVSSQISYLTPIVVSCCALAWARRFGVAGVTPLRSYAPVAVLLSWWLLYTAARATLWHLSLGPGRDAIGPDAPYSGDALLVYYAEIALRLSWPFAILATCIVVFLRRRAWWVAAPWIASAVALALAYPALRRRPQSLVEAGIASACWLASVWCIWKGHRKLRIDPPECYVPVALILGAQLGVILVVQWSGRQDTEWSIARAVQGVVYATLLGYQAVRTFRPSWTN